MPNNDSAGKILTERVPNSCDVVQCPFRKRLIEESTQRKISISEEDHRLMRYTQSTPVVTIIALEARRAQHTIRKKLQPQTNPKKKQQKIH